jgi:secondary thiamine-phosphate synthase enzyme
MTYQTTLESRPPGAAPATSRPPSPKAVAASGLRCGLAHVFVQHTSCSLTITENADPDVRRDLETIMARLAPDGDPAYRHDAEGPDDMAAHARSMLTSPA